ncbi:MAG TPA: 2-hydroxychromene-2-carboxylate isomerase [Hyphomicrobiaceae bacterium]|nr:2-hydroxychromene-2-carboxylate isomerase [Hyphomicrobiaceae bacterium]
MPVISYYMTVNSPWTYLGSARFAEIARRHGCTVDIKPAKFGEVFAKTGGFPLPKRSPERRAYRLMDMKRWRDHLKIPINLEPRYFPSNEVPGTRLLLAAKLAGKDAHALATEIGRSLWELEQDIADPAVLDACAKRAGLDAEAIRKSAPPDSELDVLHEKLTAEAISRGVFGAPSYVLESGEIFWGQDRLDFLDRALAR